MASVDFKVVHVYKDTNKMRFTSTEQTKMTGGIYKLVQKVVHGLLTRVGDDLFALDWGCYLVDSIYKPYHSNRHNEMKTEVMSSIKKVERDIMSLQVGAPDGEAILESLTLISVGKMETENRWKIELSLKVVGGSEQYITL